MVIKKSVIVTVEMNHEVPFAVLAEYIRDWVKSGQGSLYPGGYEDYGIEPDPMWNAVKKVRVRPIKRRKT